MPSSHCCLLVHLLGYTPRQVAYRCVLPAILLALQIQAHLQAESRCKPGQQLLGCLSNAGVVCARTAEVKIQSQLPLNHCCGCEREPCAMPSKSLQAQAAQHLAALPIGLVADYTIFACRTPFRPSMLVCLTWSTFHFRLTCYAPSQSSYYIHPSR